MGSSFSVVQGQTISSTVTTIAPVQNGSTVTQTPGAPVVTPPGVTPGVSVASITVGNPGFQVPSNATVPRPTNAIKGVPMLAPQGKLPMAQPHRAPVPINALPGGKPVMKEVSITVYFSFFFFFFVCLLISVISSFQYIKFSTTMRPRRHKQRKLNNHVYSFLLFRFVSSVSRFQVEF